MSADLLERLIAAGTPAGLVAEVAMEIARAEAAARAKAEPTAGALRTRRWRAAQRQDASPVTVGDADVTKVTVGDEGDASAPAPNKAPHTPKINPTPHGCEAGAHEHACEGPIPGHRLPDLLVLVAWAYWASLGAARETALKALWGGTPPPPGVSDDCWAGFLAHRKSMPKAGKFTPRAYELLCEKLAKLATAEWPPGRLLDQSIDRNWITVFPPPKDSENEHAPRHAGRQQQGRYRDPLLNVDPARIGLGGRKADG